MANARYRNWATILYPESAKEDWIEQLEQLKTPIMISPLHDQDINPGGEKKKPHYHILFCFEGKKSHEQIREITESIGAVGQEIVQSIRGYARYLCHLDNPEKYRYSEKDVRCLSGADYTGITNLAIDKYKALRDMSEFVRTNGIRSFAALCDYAASEHYDWYRILCDSGSYYMREYIKSYSWEEKDAYEKREEARNQSYHIRTEG